jgi:hypothetical protein
MALQADNREVLRNEQAANNDMIITNASCDKSYTSEYKIFVKWVKAQPGLATTEAPFLTRVNLDHYFTRVITRRKGCSNSMRRVLNALDWYAHNREHVGVYPKFRCSSSAVEEALRTQKVFNQSSGGTGRAGNDPHHGLKDILPETDKMRMMDYIYRSRHDWGPASVNFTWGINGAVRGASNRKLTLCNLNLSHGFGPERNGPLSRALLLILCRGTVHKDRHETDKQVCSWRHKNYLLCSVFSTASYVIWCTSQNPDISFLHINKNERAPWWDIPLIDWDQYSGKFLYEL